MSRACRGCILGGLVLLAVLTLGSCHYAAYQEQMQTAELPQAVWSAEHRVTFDSFVEQALTPHTLYLYVRYNSRYAYTALPLTIELRSALGWRATTSVTLPLTEEPGVWAGEGYALRQRLYKVNTSLTPPHPGLYTIELRQATGQATLAGIETVGVAWVAAE
ncbi:MAG: gliding motility lipoprotein GldH, partial [Bacteroidales bacterium]|nr:gliding motility lipoprotein GldH [Bacteroidales bacterium]